jgi:ribonuclease P protein component
MAVAGCRSFGKALRLRKRAEFLDAQKRGMRRPGRYLVVIVARREEGPTRLGVTVSRRVGPAVVRNRVKRLVREAFRLHRHELPTGLDLVVVARHEARDATLDEIVRELLRAARSMPKAKPPPRGEPC